jgi:ATP-dependent Clp protease ATP-binding subunit ClpC
VFERFTDGARRVVILAQDEARSLSHTSIGTEHLLLGLVREEQGIAARVLLESGVDLATARRQVEETVGRGATAPGSHVPFTERAKQALENALRESVRLGHNEIGTAHLLLGLLDESAATGTQILIALDVDPEQARQWVVDSLT